MIEREEHGEVTLLRMAHGRANVLDLELASALELALSMELQRARPVVLTGSGGGSSGGAFSAGVDLKRLLAEEPEYTLRFLDALDALLERLLCYPRPTVAAVNGHAIAGGSVLICACDQRLAARGEARLGLPELRVGVPFPALALELVRAALAPADFRRVVQLGEYHGVEAALGLGLVDELVEPDELLPRALSLAEELGRIPAASYAQHKRALAAPLLARVRASDRAMLASIWTSDEARAAIADYVARTLRK